MQQRLQEQLTTLAGKLNQEKAKLVVFRRRFRRVRTVRTLGGKDRFRTRRRSNPKNPKISPFSLSKKKARKAIKAKVRDIIRHSGATPMAKEIEHRMTARESQYLAYSG